MSLSKTYLRIGLVLMVVVLLASAGLAQDKYEFCSNDNWGNSKKVSVSDLREVKLPALSLLEVDGNQNGGIKVTGENRSDILVRACVRTWADTDAEARAVANNIRIATNPVVQAEGMSDDNGWSVSYQVLVPFTTNLKLTANNGGISIDSVNGNLEFATKNGGLKVQGVGGNVKGRTQNGGVKVILSGNAFSGNGLDVETKNGGVKLILPANYSANIETGTVNGGFKSDFDQLQIEQTDKKNNWSRPKRLNTSLNGGGAPIRVITTNGGVKISSSDGK